MKTLAIAAALGGIFRLARQQRIPALQSTPLPLTPREYQDRLKNRLEIALSYGDGQMWDRVSEACHRVNRDDLPGRVLGKFPHWAERLNRA